MRTIMISLSSNYTIEQIRGNNLEVFHTCKNPRNFFRELWVFNFLSFSQCSNSKESLRWNYYKLDSTSHMIEITGNWKIINRSSFPTIKHLRKLLSDKVGIDNLKYFSSGTRLIRAEDALFNGILGVVLSRLKNIPLMVGIWGNPKRIRSETNKPLMPKLFKFKSVETVLERFVIRKANLVAVENIENMSYPLSIGIPRNKISIFGLGLMMHPAHLSQPESRPVKDSLKNRFGDINQIWISISRLEELKYINEYPNIVRRVADVLPESLFILIGSGSQLEYLQKRINEYRLENNFLIMENLNQIEISQISTLATAQSALLCGRSLLELSLAGLPCVAYNVDWHKEIVTDDTTGFLVKVGNSDAIADKIIWLLSNPKQAKKYGVQMRRHALAKVSRESGESGDSEIIKAYKQLIFQPYETKS